MSVCLRPPCAGGSSLRSTTGFGSPAANPTSRFSKWGRKTDGALVAALFAGLLLLWRASCQLVCFAVEDSGGLVLDQRAACRLDHL